MSKLFDRVSTEDDTYASATDLPIDEIISRQSDEDEFNEIAAELEDDIEAVEEADDLVDGLEEVVTGCEALLDNPSQVTAAHVLVAQETLRMTGLMLGTKIEENISLETATESPVTALELSVEGIKDFIVTVIEQVKAIFRRIITAIKNLFVKAVSVADNTDGKAKLLIAEIKDIKDKPGAKFNDKVIKKLKDQFAGIAFGGSNGINIPKLDASTILKFIDAINNLETLKNVTDFSKKLKEFLSNYMSDKTDDEKSKLVEQMTKALTVYQSKTPAVINNFTTIASAASPKQIEYFTPVRFGDKNITGLAIAYKGTSTDVKQIPMITLTKQAITIDPAKINSLDVLKISEVNTVLSAMRAKSADSYRKTVMDLIDVNNKAIAEYEKLANANKNMSSAEKAILVKFVSHARTIVTTFGLDSIMGQINGNRKVLNYCMKCVEAHKQTDK